MLQSWKRIVVPGVLIVTGLSVSGFLGAPQASPPRPSPVPSVPAGESRTNPPVLIEQRFELLKEVGKARGLAPQVHHVYFVDLKAGQLLRAAVQQEGIDVYLELSGPPGQPLIVIDSPNANRGEEPVLLVARLPGRYRMVVSTHTEQHADQRYVIKIAEVRRATSLDRRKASALQSYYAAKDLGRRGGEKPAELLRALDGAVHSLESSSAPMRLLAYAWHDLGILYESQNLRRESLDADRKAAALFHRLGMKDREATVLIAIGRTEQQLPDIKSALKHFEQARALAQAAGAEKEEASASEHLGMFYADRADVWNATRHLQRALSLHKKDRDDNGQAMALTGFGVLYTRLGDNENALKYLEAQLRQLKLSPLKKAIVLTQIGQVYVNIGRSREAFQYFRQAYDLQESGDDPANQANALVGFGLAYTRVRDFRNALDSFRKALRIYRDREDSLAQAITFMNIGWVLGSLQRYEEAGDSFRRSLSLVRPMKNPVLEGGVLLGFAWIERLRGNFSGAQRQAEEALKRVESTRLGIADQESKISYLASMQDFYELLVGALMDQHGFQKSRVLLERALQVSESGRSRGLLDTLGAPVANRLSPVLTAREIQQQVLDPDTILLEYSLGDPESYLFLVTANEIRRFDLPPGVEIEALAQGAYEALAKSRFSRQSLRPALQKVKELSRMLIGPVADQLGDKRVVIVSSGALQLFPIGILPDPTVSSTIMISGLAWPQPLLLRHDIVYEPSASVLAGIRRVARSRRPASNLLAALGNAVFERDDKRIPGPAVKRGSGSDPVLGYLDPLPASQQEVEAITAGLPARKVFKALGFEAHRDLFVTGRLNDFSVIHIATHTYSSERPERSAMVFSRFDRKGRAREGLLRIQDVSAMDLRSDLVVLSSCSSGLGKQVRGEGIVGWPWAFLSAGASGVVMSLWDVEDQSTADFMKQFYENMSKGSPSGSALRETQIQMWNEGKPPWVWAGFAALGEWNIRPLSLNKTNPAVSSQGGDPRNPTMTKKSLPSNPLWRRRESSRRRSPSSSGGKAWESETSQGGRIHG